MITNVPFLSLEQAITKAHQTKDIKFLLLPWLQFRLYVRFAGREKKTSHFYGNEHQVTYNQCLYGKIPHILLFKKKGYNELIRFVEESLGGRYISAKIYMRSDPSQGFDVLCREYYKGGLVKNLDPVLSDDEGLILYYTVKKGRVEVQEKAPEAPEKIDFKSLVNESLNV